MTGTSTGKGGNRRKSPAYACKVKTEPCTASQSAHAIFNDAKIPIADKRILMSIVSLASAKEIEIGDRKDRWCMYMPRATLSKMLTGNDDRIGQALKIGVERGYLMSTGFKVHGNGAFIYRCGRPASGDDEFKSQMDVFLNALDPEPKKAITKKLNRRFSAGCKARIKAAGDEWPTIAAKNAQIINGKWSQDKQAEIVEWLGQQFDKWASL